MGLFSRKKKLADSAAERIDGRELLYVVRRYMDDEGNQKEDGLGHGGRIDTANGHVIITCANKEVFVNSDVASVKCSELMSLGGAIFTGYNEVIGKDDTVVAYYQSKFKQ
jgi:hypothetical protein